MDYFILLPLKQMIQLILIRHPIVQLLNFCASEREEKSSGFTSSEQCIPMRNFSRTMFLELMGMMMQASLLMISELPGGEGFSGEPGLCDLPHLNHDCPE